MPNPTPTRRLKPPRMPAVVVVALGVAILATGGVRAADDDFFETRIRPLLVDRCLGCHSGAPGAKRSGALALDTRDGWQAGGDSGAAIVPGDPGASLVVRAVKRADGVSAMPPAEAGPPLTADEIAALETWIAAGAPDPRVALARLGGMDRDTARTFWSFQAPRAAAPPPVADEAHVANDIDRFVLAALEARGLGPEIGRAHV